MEITITGIRYAICPIDMSMEDKDSFTQDYLSKIPKGKKIILKAQPDNPFDHNAIAAYINYSQRIGYVSAGELEDVKSLLDENDILECSVVRWEHVTLFLEAEGETAFGNINLKEEDKFAKTPFEEYAKLSLEDDEHLLDIISLKVFTCVLPDDDIPDEWLDLTEKFLEKINISVSMKHLNWKSRMRKLLRKVYGQYKDKNLIQLKLDRLSALLDKAESHVSDSTRDGGKCIIFANQLKRLRERAKEENELFQQFDKHHNTLYIKDENKKCNINSIDEWLRQLPDGIGSNFLIGDYNSFATKVAYHKPSTKDIYRLASVLLIRERMKGEEYYKSVENTTQVVDVAYPTINEMNRRLFADTYYPEKPLNIGIKKRKCDVPKDKILHSIFDLSKEWNPALRTSVHKWRMMYEMLYKMKLIKSSDRKQYRLFVTSIVAYCFPSVKDTYSDNISKTFIDENLDAWNDEDKQMYKELKKALTL